MMGTETIIIRSLRPSAFSVGGFPAITIFFFLSGLLVSDAKLVSACRVANLEGFGKQDEQRGPEDPGGGKVGTG